MSMPGQVELVPVVGVHRLILHGWGIGFYPSGLECAFFGELVVFTLPVHTKPWLSQKCIGVRRYVTTPYTCVHTFVALHALHPRRS